MHDTFRERKIDTQSEWDKTLDLRLMRKIEALDGTLNENDESDEIKK